MDDIQELKQTNSNCCVADDFAKQLHEQYSINDNAKTTHVIGFITAIAFIFIGFGYVYVQPYLSNKPLPDYSLLLLSVDILADVMLILLSFLCVCFGCATRRDHVVITRIRDKYIPKDKTIWFKGKYNGFGKNEFNYLPDYYRIMFVFIQIFIILLALGCSINTGVIEPSKCHWFAIALISIFINLGCWICHYCKYLEFLSDKEKSDK